MNIDNSGQGDLIKNNLSSWNFDNDVPPRIGLRGTAKIFGEEVKLFFFLFRKPIIFVRQTLGL